MEKSFIKKLKIIRIFLIVSFITEIGLFINQPILFYFIFILLYGVLNWIYGSKREKIIKAFFFILSVFIVIGFFRDDFSIPYNSVFLTSVVQFLYSLMLLILLGYFVLFLKNIKSTKLVTSLLMIFIWIFIALIIIIAMFILFSLLNGGAYTSLQIVVLVILSIISSFLISLPMVLLLYIIQQSTEQEFYNAFFKKNPSDVIREATNHYEEHDDSI